MTVKNTIIVVASCLACFAGDAFAPATEEEGERERRRGSNREQVGATMWRVRPHDTPYDKWLAENRERIPTFEGLLIQDARTEPLSHWEDMGVDGLYIKMADYQITDGWILEIPPK
jgi:hypothetical protein